MAMSCGFSWLLDRGLRGQLVVAMAMRSGWWGWIVPDGLWEPARPLLPPTRVRRQGGGVANIDDGARCSPRSFMCWSAAVPWRALPPCFAASKPTVHRRFLICSRAGVWGRLHQKVLQLLDGRNLIDLSRAVPDSAHVRAKGGELAGPSPVDRGKPGSRMHILSDANGLPVRVGLSAANTHDSLGLKPILSHFHMGHESHVAESKPNASTRTTPMMSLTCGDGCGANTSASASPARASTPANDSAAEGGSSSAPCPG
ncbi:transposase [Streptomyces sp. NBC_01187]|uniref:transposase n=1 Tax=Streptomyces sp. NBC_01187 TaxID=2903766 RepID=UPI00386F3EB7